MAAPFESGQAPEHPRQIDETAVGLPHATRGMTVRRCSFRWQERPLKNDAMDVVDLLGRAVAVVPVDVVNEAGATAADAREYLDHNEWQVALDLLADLYEGWRPTPQWWDLLVEAAELMWLVETAAWCHWGRWESIHGIIRAELRLLPSAEGGRAMAVPGRGILRPLWDIGQRTAAGQPDLRVARVWVEHAPELAPGAIGTVRLAPLDPPGWHSLRPGHPITMHEGMPVVGEGIIVEAVNLP